VQQDSANGLFDSDCGQINFQLCMLQLILQLQLRQKPKLLPFGCGLQSIYPISNFACVCFEYFGLGSTCWLAFLVLTQEPVRCGILAISWDWGHVIFILMEFWSGSIWVLVKSDSPILSRPRFVLMSFWLATWL